MANPLITESTIAINAPAERVWQVLTAPEETKMYMFGCETVSTWQPGTPLLWRGTYEGQTMDFVKGSIVSIEPGKKLVYTTIDPNGKYTDVPANYLTVTYALTEQEGKTTLYVSQGDYSTVADRQARYQETIQAGGWSSVLQAIKKVAEEV